MSAAALWDPASAGFLPSPNFFDLYVALGRQLQVKSTPTFFINGVKIEGALPPQYFDQAIAYELQHAAAK